MELNRNTDMLLCNLAFQEYNIRQNILGLIVKKNNTSNEKQKQFIQLEIDKLRANADYLFELRSEKCNYVDICQTK